MDLVIAYQAILGRPCYVESMDVPNYAYLKLKLLGPRGTITVSGDLHHAHSCEEENLNIAADASRAPKLWAIQATMTEVAPESSARKQSSGTSKPTEDTKGVQVDPDDAN